MPREKSLIVAWPTVGSNQIADYESFNPFVPGVASRTGYNFLYEPLYFYNVETDSLTHWIARSHHYSDDFREVTVSIRPDVLWSDGVPWTAHDLVFTIDMLKSHAPALLFSTEIDTWMEEATALDSLTARIRLHQPHPRFLFTYFTHHFDNGIPIVPRHIWDGQDPETFANLDIERSWPVVTGPYRMTLSTPEQRIYDVRQDWWAATAGFQSLPQVERLIYLPSQTDTKLVQTLMLDEIDTSIDLRPASMIALLQNNPRISTWTGRDPPYGSLNSWTVSLGFNAMQPPYDDVEVRRAINHAIDRQQLVEVGWQGAGSHAIIPFPDFAAMKRFTDPLQDLLERFPVDAYDPERSARIMISEGFTRDSDGYWARAEERLGLSIGIGEIFNDIAPVLTAQLQRAGFDATLRMTADVGTRMSQGRSPAYLMGHPGSVRDPHFTLSFYHSRFVRPTGTHSEYFWRWRNERFDAHVDSMARLATDDPRMATQFHKAMELWLEELPSIPLVQWYHRVPYNTTYRQGWPSAEDPYTQNAFWHRTWLLVLLKLRPTGVG